MYRHYAEGSWKWYIKTVKQIFSIAARGKWIDENQFAHIRGGGAMNTNPRFYITQEMTAKVLEAWPKLFQNLRSTRESELLTQ